ncbi:MAG: Holliday junction branch migration protein RuvA [Deferribacteraceae bacterium]|jgi:Holliday junction DNA helicase RuvA|nr:Holliday junction branch migration protein RuvA [Deferribacteraceae bacterium]
MIYKISGKLIAKDGGRVAVDVGGVAYDIMLSMNSYAGLPALGEDCELFTHFVLREDGAYLYGFSSLDEKALFLQLITVSKIGPKLALAILGNMGAAELVAAVTGQDDIRLSKVPGIGKKTAERIIVELKDKLQAVVGAPTRTAAPKSVRDDVISALCNLGYKPADCEKVVARLDMQDFNTMLRKALAELS